MIEEGAETLLAFRAGAEMSNQRGSVGTLLALCHAGEFLREFLGGGEGMRAALQQHFGLAGDSGIQFVGGHDSMDEANVFGAGGIEPLGSKKECTRL